MVAYDTNGGELGFREGTEYNVAFPKSIKSMHGDSASGMVLHHNHVKGEGLSALDIEALGHRGIRAIWAHSHNGVWYRCEIADGVRERWASSDGIIGSRLRDSYALAREKVKRYVQESAFDGRIAYEDVDVALANIDHSVCIALQDAGLIKYASNYEIGSAAKALAPFHAAIDAATAAVKEKNDIGVWGDVVSKSWGLGAPTPLFDTLMRDTLAGRASTALGIGKLNLTEARVKLQDKFARIKNLENRVGLTDTDISTYQAESLYYGRTGYRLEQLEKHTTEPLIEEMSKRGISAEAKIQASPEGLRQMVEPLQCGTTVQPVAQGKFREQNHA